MKNLHSDCGKSENEENQTRDSGFRKVLQARVTPPPSPRWIDGMVFHTKCSNGGQLFITHSCFLCVTQMFPL